MATKFQLTLACGKSTFSRQKVSSIESMNLPCKEVLSEREGILLMTLMSGSGWGGDPNAWAECMNESLCFFYCQIFAKIRPEKYDFDGYKGFFIGKMVQISQILKRKEIQIARFLQ
jgi:hypothetical protein